MTADSSQMVGLLATVLSLGAMKANAVPWPIVTPTGLLSVTLKRSTPSATASSMIGTLSVRMVSPGRKAMLPWLSWKSLPAVAVSPLVL